MVWPGSLLLLNGKQKGKRCLRAIDNWEGKSIGIRMDSLEKGKRSGKRFCKGRTDLLAVRGHAQDYVCVSFCATTCLCNSQRLISTHCCSSSEAAQALKLRGGGPSRATPPTAPPGSAVPAGDCSSSGWGRGGSRACHVDKHTENSKPIYPFASGIPRSSMPPLIGPFTCQYSPVRQRLAVRKHNQTRLPYLN